MPRTRCKGIFARADAVLAAAVLVVACFLYLSAAGPTAAAPRDCSKSTAAPQTVAPGGESPSRASCVGVRADAANNCTGPATAPETVAAGWNASFRAGCYDAAGNLMGGSELMYLVGHNGMLFAAVGYWEDSANVCYGGNNSSEGWGQILRLDQPNGHWAVDLNLTGVVRPEVLKSVTFTTNAEGQPLSKSVTLLVSGGYSTTTGDVDLYTRNDPETTIRVRPVRPVSA
ncbi:MAG: hypothetical protein L3K03_01520 [Thermoplasmata archaeon]|nr:hypothetical protein [Thermoplasmata archaeon]